MSSNLIAGIDGGLRIREGCRRYRVRLLNATGAIQPEFDALRPILHAWCSKPKWLRRVSVEHEKRVRLSLDTLDAII